MPPTAVKAALWGAMEDLTKQDMEKFCHQLLDRREEPRVSRSRVEGKNVCEIVDVLVSTFTEFGALPVVVELLTQIGCNEEAQKLGEITGISAC